MERIILHLDLDAFFCAVEELHNANLHGKAFAVGGESDQRGVVASCSYAARMYGVRSAMPMGTAKRLCPDLIVVPQNRHAYSDYSKQVMALLNSITPLVEQLSIDEAFLDVTGLKSDGEAIARDIQHEIRESLELPSSLGVANNKLVAKIANNIGKARKKSPEPPCAIEVVPIGTEAAYLAPLPIRELWGIGPKTAEQMHQLGIQTIGDIAQQREAYMMHHFGKSGYDYWRRAQGIDNRPVEPEQETKSISRETTFNKDLRDGAELRRVLRVLSEEVGRRLRKAELSGATIQIKLRWSDFTTITRQVTLSHPTQDDAVITEEALKLFNKHWNVSREVRLIGVGVSKLEQGAHQLPLWESDDTKRGRKLQQTLDDLRERFGDSAIKRGSDIKKR